MSFKITNNVFHADFMSYHYHLEIIIQAKMPLSGRITYKEYVQRGMFMGVSIDQIKSMAISERPPPSFGEGI